MKLTSPMNRHPAVMRIEDEGSMSSTVEADALFCVPSPDDMQSYSNNSHGRKRPLHVRFELSANEIHPSPLSLKQIPDLWYSPSDYDAFRASYFTDVRECVCEDRLRRTKSEDKKSPSVTNDSMETILLGVYEKCCLEDQEKEYIQSVLTSEEESILSMVLNRDEALVGMERSCVRRIRQGRKLRQRELQDMVRYIQNHDGSSTQEAKIRVVAQEVSRPCRQMAFQMAKALAASLD